MWTVPSLFSHLFNLELTMFEKHLTCSFKALFYCNNLCYSSFYPPTTTYFCTSTLSIFDLRSLSTTYRTTSDGPCSGALLLLTQVSLSLYLFLIAYLSFRLSSHSLTNSWIRLTFIQKCFKINNIIQKTIIFRDLSRSPGWNLFLAILKLCWFVFKF